jgi:hypothetical protein
MDTWLGKISTWTDEANALATGANTNKLAAEAAETNAKEWAENPEDVEVEAGQYSAKHHAAKAADSETNAAASASKAESFAQSAINAPGTSATSTTSVLIGTGSKSLTIQTGKDIVVGMFVLIARTSAPTNYMAGQVTSYNSETGALAVFINSVGGSGTYTDWTISLSAITFDAATEAEMKAGTETAVRTMSPADIKTATKGIQMVASGTLTDGSVVSLNPDGTVSITYNVVPEAGLPVVFESADTRYISAVFDSLNNKVVIAYRDSGNAYYGTAIVGTVSGTSISFGTPVVFESADLYYISATFDSLNNKVVIAYRDGGNANYGTAVVGTVSGTSISFGTPVVFESADTSYISAVFDSLNNKVVIAYRDSGNSSYGTAIVGTVSGTSISFGTPVVFESAASYYISAAFDSLNNKVVIAYRDAGNASYGTAVVGTVSGTSISFGTPVVFESADISFISATFDSLNNKVVIAYRDGGNSSYGTAIVGTVSGTSISFGTPVVFESADTQYISAAFDSLNNKVVIAYRDAGNASYGTAVVGTVSGTSISFGTPVVFESADISFISATFDSSSNKVVIAYQDVGNANYGTAVTFDSYSYTNVPEWIGISSDAYLDTETATIFRIGDVANNQAGLTPNAVYYVDLDGTLTTNSAGGRKIGKALSATELLITEGNT